MPPLMPPMGPGGPTRVPAAGRLNSMPMRWCSPVVRQLFLSHRSAASRSGAAQGQRGGRRAGGGGGCASISRRWTRSSAVGGSPVRGALSYADIAMFMTIIWTQRLKGPALKDYSALAAWFERLKALLVVRQGGGGNRCWLSGELTRWIRGTPERLRALPTHPNPVEQPS